MRCAGLAVAVLGLGGCLIPQDDTLLAELPEQRNRPPRIIEQQVQPLQRLIKEFGGADGCEISFEVKVEDFDVDDALYVRWYIDSQPQKTETRLTNNGSAQRGEAAELFISLRAANSPLSAPGPHLVEAVVADGLVVDGKPQHNTHKLPDGGTIEDLVYVDTYAWFINTVQGDCQ